MTQGRRGRWWLLWVALAAGLLWWWWRAVGEGVREEGASEGAAVGGAVGRREGAEVAVDLRLALRASVSGTVRDPHGAAVAGAKVCALPYAPGLTREQAAPRCVASGRDGYYRIDELWPVPHGVHASAAGFIAAAYSQGDRRSITLRPGMDRRDVDVTLIGGGVEIFGVVRDLSGGAVEGARVFVTGGAVRGDGVALTESGVDGEFSLWVRPGEAQVWASGEGYAQGVDVGAAPGHRFVVFLTPEAVLVGTLLRADDGSPVEGAQVGAERGDVGMSWGVNIGNGAVISDANGRFRIEGLAAGAYKVVAGSDEWTGSAAEQVVLGVGETSEPIVVAMHPAYVVEAKVEADGGPGCGGSVMLEDRVRAREAFGQVDVDGTVRVQRVLPGDYSVQLRCDGYVVEEAPEPVRVVDAGVKGLRWKVTWGRSLTGVVVDAKGQPAAGVWVYARQEVDPAQATVVASGGGHTDALGRFVVNGLQAGTYRLNLQDWNGGRAMPAEPTVVQVGERGVEGVRVELPASGELRGTVRDEQGRALARVRVQLSAEGLRPGVNVGDDGSFVFAALAPGSYRVAAWRGSEPLRAREGSESTVEVKVGATTRVDLVFAAANGEIRGVVRDEDGGALADAFVSARLEVEGAPAGSAVRERWMSSGDRPRLSEADGQFTLTGLMPGTYSLLAQRRGGGEATREHVAVGETVTLTIAAVGRISGRVVLPGGGSPEEFNVSVWDRASGFRRSDSNFRTGGAWGFAELPAGNYEVEVTAAEGVVKRSVALAAGEVRADVLVELAGMTRVSGTVVDTEGNPVAGVEVLIRGDHTFQFGRDGDRRHISDANGRFEVERVPVGTATLMAMAAEAGYSAPRMNVQIPAGERFELPPLRIARERVAQGELSGDLGFVVQGPEPGAELDGRRYVVTLVRAGGAAAQAGLVVGDEIVAVDGTPVAGAAGYLFDALTRVSAGTTVQLGLARGGVVAVVAGR